jgi:hypothetical protein
VVRVAALSDVRTDRRCTKLPDKRRGENIGATQAGRFVPVSASAAGRNVIIFSTSDEFEKAAATFPRGAKSRAFVSHGSQDDRYVQEMVQYLRSLGYEQVFNDGHTIQPDELFWDRIETGICECDAFIVILSHSSVNSYWVDREVQFAREQGKRVIPVRIDDCKLPSSFAGRDVVDLRPGRGEKVKIAPSRILRHSPPILFGREQWLDALDAVWANPKLNVYTLVAWGGVGKTSLVVHWVSQRVAAKGWLCVDRYFDWSFYTQGTGESRQTSSDQFIHEALKFFDDPDPMKGSPWERGERLAALIRRNRTLLVLDGIEPLQYPVSDPQAGRLKDQALEALLQGLAANNAGLCIVTTRARLKNIESQATASEQKLDTLTKAAAVALLRHLQVVGTESELAAAWKDAGGHALTLRLLGRFLADAHGGDVRRYKEVKFEEADLERQGRSAFKVMIAYERWLQSVGPERQRELAILRLTGLFDRPISRACLQALRAKPAIPGLTHLLVQLNEAQWNVALNRLGEIDLLTVTPDAVDAHPLIREYFAKQTRETLPTAFKAAHSRLFDHLCQATPYRPDTLEGLQPLYEAVAHGCLAGRQQEACAYVYDDRIMRGKTRTGHYAWRNLGATGTNLAAVAAFFDAPWSIVSGKLNDSDQAWMLAEAAYGLLALGRPIEALESLRVAFEMAVQQEDWVNAAMGASTLTELEVMLGRLGNAVAHGRQSIKYADQSGDVFTRISKRATTAGALFLSGRRDEAGALFAEAESMEMKRQRDVDALYSLRGFNYCAWILAPAERAAWQALLRHTPGKWRWLTGAFARRTFVRRRLFGGQRTSSVAELHGLDGIDGICVEVERRAREAQRAWREVFDNAGVLDIAVDHLSLARVGLIRAILSGPLPQSTLELPDVAAAVNGLRNAGRLGELTEGLLTAALYHFVRGDSASGGMALNEAQAIAERGPMPLYLADIHLHRARLFRQKAELAKASVLIEKHSYWRRMGELEDAQAAAENWSA